MTYNFVDATGEPVLPDTSNVLNINATNEISISLSPKGVTIEMKIILFQGQKYEEMGGWDDFQGYFDSVEEAKDCSELWDTDNGRTLCHPCHKLTDTYGWKLYNKSR